MEPDPRVKPVVADPDDREIIEDLARQVRTGEIFSPPGQEEEVKSAARQLMEHRGLSSLVGIHTLVEVSEARVRITTQVISSGYTRWTKEDKIPLNNLKSVDLHALIQAIADASEEHAMEANAFFKLAMRGGSL